MDVFYLRQRVIGEYTNYVGSFVTIDDARIRDHVDAEMRSGVLWPQLLVQLNLAFEPGDDIESLVRARTLHSKCLVIFRDKPTPSEDRGLLRLHRHQVEGLALDYTRELRGRVARLCELGLVEQLGRTKRTRYTVSPGLLRASGLDCKTTLARLPPIGFGRSSSRTFAAIQSRAGGTSTGGSAWRSKSGRSAARSPISSTKSP